MNKQTLVNWNTFSQENELQKKIDTGFNSDCIRIQNDGLIAVLEVKQACKVETAGFPTWNSIWDGLTTHAHYPIQFSMPAQDWVRVTDENGKRTMFRIAPEKTVLSFRTFLTIASVSLCLHLSLFGSIELRRLLFPKVSLELQEIQIAMDPAKSSDAEMQSSEDPIWINKKKASKSLLSLLSKMQKLSLKSINMTPIKTNNLASTKLQTISNSPELLAKLKNLKLDTGPDDTVTKANEKELAEAFQKYYGSFRQCYEGVLLKNPEFFASIQVEALVDPSGKLTQPQIQYTNAHQDTQAKSDLSRCMNTVVNNMKVSNKNAGITVRNSFVFRS